MSKSLKRDRDEGSYIDIESIKSKINPKIQKLVKDMGYEVVDIDIKRGKTLVFEVEIYSKNKSISLKDCEKVSNVISRLLDVEDPIPTRYNLLVSSPGVDRVFRNPNEYEIFAGKEVEVKLNNFSSYNLSKDVFIAKLIGIEGDVVKFDYNGNEVWVDLSDIVYTKLYFDAKKYFGGD
ncbi:MAG: hypothetical protein N2712_03970 [Brevinematales bacterium]|nr:hypothetical protein [Brevinematales bacterium]